MHGTRFFTGVACALLVAGSTLAAVPASAAPAPRGATATWQVDKRLPLDTAESPQEFSNGYTFLDVAGVGPQDAWAVGTSGYYIGAYGRPVLRHWHDGRWLSPYVPAWMNGSDGGWVNQFQAVGGSSPDDVWVLGEYQMVTKTLLRAVHWNGTSWTKATLPFQGLLAPTISSVQSFGTSDAWAFGCYCEASQSAYIAHFSGGHWHNVTPKGGTLYGAILDATAISPTDIWAVAGQGSSSFFSLLHWDGTSWTALAVPASLPDFSAGNGIVATAQGDVWLAGSLEFGGEPAVVEEDNGVWTLTQVAASAPLTNLISDGAGGLWATAQEQYGDTSAQIWHYSDGAWAQAADPPGVSAPYRFYWAANLPGTQTSLAVGSDSKHELLYSYAPGS